jgi:hypothetical protein
MSPPADGGATGPHRASLPSVNPLQKARESAGTAWQGTKRTTGWVKDGVTGVFRSDSGDSSEGSFAKPAKEPGPVRDGISGAWDRVGGASLIQRGRADSRVGAALIIGAIVVLLWIAWTVYVWTENGTAAGLGVLISWPAVLLALALVAAPFVGAVVLVRRLAADGGPTLAVAGGGTAEDAAADATADDPEDEAEPEEASEDEDGEEEEEEPDDSEDEDGDSDEGTGKTG